VKIKTLIIIPVILIAVAYLATKGYIHYKVTENLDKVIRVAAPFVHLEYGGVGSSLNGSIYLDKVLVTPTGSYDEISIRRLIITGDGPLFLFDLAQGFDRGELPEQMSIAIQQLESPISSSFLSSLMNTFNNSNSVLKTQKLDPCSLAGILQVAGLKELGFPSLTINSNIGYKYDKASGQVQFDFVNELAGVELSSISLKMNGLSTAVITGLGKMPVLEELHFVTKFEPGYMKQIVTLCSANSAQTPDAYIDRLFTQPDRHYLTTLGFIPGPGLTAMLKQLVTNAGELDVWAIPSSGIDPSTLSAYRTEDLMDLLGVAVSYNNKPVTDLSFSLESTKPKAIPSSKVAPSPKPILKQRPVATTKTGVKPRSKLRYVETKISDLPKYLNYRVRIYTIDNDIPKRGLLVSIKHQTINVEQLLYNGKMTSHLHMSRITKLEVLRRE
jgi:hypothetical protein